MSEKRIELSNSKEKEEEEEDQYLFSYESPTSSYPSIPFPVAFYINKNCPEIVEKASMFFESRSATPNTPTSRSVSTTASSSSSLEPSPLRSMANTSEGLSLPQTFIGLSSVPNSSSPFSYSNTVKNVCNPLIQNSDQNSATVKIESIEATVSKNIENKDVVKSASKNNNCINNGASLANFRSSNISRTPPVGTHRSPILNDDILSDLEYQRTGTISSKKHRDNRPIENCDTLSNFSEAFENESIFSSISGIEEEMIEVQRTMTKIPFKTTSLPRRNKSKLDFGTQTEEELSIDAVQTLTNKNESIKKQFDTLREKTNLEEQVCALKSEIAFIANEKTQLLESLSSKEARINSLSVVVSQSKDENEKVSCELKTITKEYRQWKSVIQEYQAVIDLKINEVKSLKEDLSAAEIQAEKLTVCLEESKVETEAKDAVVQGLKLKIAELHVEAQILTNGKIHYENEITSLKSEKETVKKSKEWYVKQLHTAQESKNDLHKELINLQAEFSGIFVQFEQTKSDNYRLKEQLEECDFKTVKEKEVLMKHLENIEADMLEREAIFQQIELDKGSAEETIGLRMKKLEEEQSKLTNYKLKTSDLEYNYQTTQKANLDLTKMVSEMENEKRKFVTELAQLRRKTAEHEITRNQLEGEKLNCEKLLGHIEQQLRNEERKVGDLKREKTEFEISLASANGEKKEVNEALKILQNNLSALEGNFKHMHTELINKTSKLSHLLNENQRLEDSIQLLEKQLLYQKLTFQEQSSKESRNSDVYIDDLKKQIGDLGKVVDLLKFDNRKAEKEASMLKKYNALVVNNERELRNEIEKLESAKRLSIANKSSNPVSKMVVEQSSSKSNDNNEPEVYKLQALMESNEIQFKSRLRSYESNVKVLTRKLKQVMKELKQKSLALENYSSIAKSSIDHVEIKTNSTKGIQTEEDTSDEKSLTDVEKMMERYGGEQVSTLDAKLIVPCTQCPLKDDILEERQNIILQLEKDNGQLKGSIDGKETVRDQLLRLENILAEKDVKLATLRQQYEELKEQHEQATKKIRNEMALIEEELSKEKTVAKDLRYQIFQEKREVKHLKNQLNAIKSRLVQSQQDGEQLKSQLTKLRQDSEVKQKEKHLLNAEIQHTRNLVKENQHKTKLLEDELLEVQSRDPALAEQMKALSWHLKEKNQELMLIKKQLEINEQRSVIEKETIVKKLQCTETELNEVKVELSTARKEKFTFQANVSELKGALRSSVNLAKNLRSQVPDKTNSPDLSLCIPQSPAPYDESFVNSLLKQSLTLPESRPLSNLQACLNSLKQEMSVLQKEVEKRTTLSK